MTDSHVLEVAHKLTSRSAGTGVVVAQTGESDVLVGSTEFRDFLVHLFVLSILWVHFKQAETWSVDGDLGDNKLNFEQFRMACRTFTTAQAHETFTEQSLLDDFKMLDVDNSGSIEFSEVSNKSTWNPRFFCCFVHTLALFFTDMFVLFQLL